MGLLDVYKYMDNKGFSPPIWLSASSWESRSPPGSALPWQSIPVHKLFMGLLDVYKYMDNKTALAIAEGLGDWFYRWSGEYSQEEFDDILDVETGGMLEIWADPVSSGMSCCPAPF